MVVTINHVYSAKREEKSESGEFQQFLVTEFTRMEQNIMDFAAQHQLFCSGLLIYSCYIPFFPLNCFWWTRDPFLYLFSYSPPLRGQPTVEYHPR
jgi:hypothetical protein